MSLTLRGERGVGEKKTFWIRIRQNQIKGGSNPPCGFSLPISGLSFISGPWWGCHVDRPTSYYDNGSRGSTCSGGYCLLGDVRKTGGMCTKTKIEGVIDTRKASVEGEVKLECVGPEVWIHVCACVCACGCARACDLPRHSGQFTFALENQRGPH